MQKPGFTKNLVSFLVGYSQAQVESWFIFIVFALKISGSRAAHQYGQEARNITG
jgi:hypothetical protein